MANINNKRFLGWIEECNQYNLGRFLTFNVEGQSIGYVNRNFAKYLHHYPHIINISEQEIRFVDNIQDFDSRTAAMAELTADLYQRRVLKSWVGEHYDVAVDFDHTPLFTIERAAATPFGINKFGVHLNAYVQKQGQYYLWVARRSRTKPTWPGKLDHLVAGGHTSNMSIQETLVKECAEEAALPQILTEQAKAVGIVDYTSEIDDKLSRDTLFVYDILLPQTFVPENTDGEVECFFLWPIEKVLETVSNTREYKTNCNLVIIDFAVRHGFIRPDQAHYMSIVKGLRDNGLEA